MFNDTVLAYVLETTPAALLTPPEDARTLPACPRASISMRRSGHG